MAVIGLNITLVNVSTGDAVAFEARNTCAFKTTVSVGTRGLTVAWALVATLVDILTAQSVPTVTGLARTIETAVTV